MSLHSNLAFRYLQGSQQHLNLSSISTTSVDSNLEVKNIVIPDLIELCSDIKMNRYLIFIMQGTDSKNIKLAHMAKQNEVPD